MENTPATRALTVHQPWASQIVRGTKQAENRTWPTTYRGRLLIHAARVPVGDLPTSAIIGWVTLVGVSPPDQPSGLPGGLPGMYHWHLADPVELDHPVPCRGQQGLWITPPRWAASWSQHGAHTGFPTPTRTPSCLGV